jgi:hypothetical protein
MNINSISFRLERVGRHAENIADNCNAVEKMLEMFVEEYPEYSGINVLNSLIKASARSAKAIQLELEGE